MHVVPLLSNYNAFLDEVLFAVSAHRTMSKLYWAVGPPSMTKLAESRLPDTFDKMLRAHVAEPGATRVYVFELTEATLTPTSSPEHADTDRLDVLTPVRQPKFKGGAGSGKSTSSGSTGGTSASPTSSHRSGIFRGCVCEYDQMCVLCGDVASPEAAHIIPLRAVTDPALRACLEDAKLDPTTIDSSHNGMRLCATHHVAFDAYFWTVDPSNMKVVVAADAADSIRKKAGAELDFSGRTLSYTVPPKHLWRAYYKHLYQPATHARPGALAGGRGRGGRRGGGARHGGAAGGAGAPAAPAGAGSAVRRGGARGE